jgi:hypothetical protein
VVGDATQQFRRADAEPGRPSRRGRLKVQGACVRVEADGTNVIHEPGLARNLWPRINDVATGERHIPGTLRDQML